MYRYLSSALTLFALLLQASPIQSSSSITTAIPLDAITADDPSSIADWTSVNDFTSADSLTPLQSAAKYDAVRMIEALLSHGADLHAKHPTTKETAVMYAARTGSQRALEKLLSKGGSATDIDADGRTALHLAGLELYEGSGSEAMVGLLVGRGLAVDLIDSRGNTALHIACFFGGDAQYVSALLEVGAEVDRVDDNGNAALHFSAKTGKMKETRLLLEAGAKVGLKNLNGETALKRAREAMKMDVVLLLEEWGAGRRETFGGL